MNAPRLHRPWLLLAALLILLPAAAPPAETARERFLKQQTGLAKDAARKRDWDAAAAAWERIREYDSSSLVALEGLVTVSASAGDSDAEALYLRALNVVLEKAVAAGETSHARRRDEVLERLAQIDPQHDASAALEAAYRKELTVIASAYEEDGLAANALLAAVDLLEVAEPGSDVAVFARDLARRVVASGEDWLARSSVLPDLSEETHSEEWIEDFDKSTLKWSRAGKWETPHYRIKVAGSWRLGEATARSLEQVHAFYREIWGIAPDPLPPEGAPEGLRNLTIPPIDIFIYGDHAEYIKRSGAPDWSGGVFTGSEVSTYNHGSGGGGSSRATLGTLFHEASHQFMNVVVGPSVPSFINEGVASLFEGIEIMPNGSIRRDLPVPGRLKPLATGLRNGTAPKLRAVIDGPGATGNEPRFYAPRWGFVYFLRMATDQAGDYVFRPRFDDYMQEFKRGAPGDTAEHLQEFFAEEFEAMGFESFRDFDDAWQDFILDLDEETRSGEERIEGFLKDGRLELLKKKPAAALGFYEKAFDLDPDEPRAVAGAAEACALLEQADRAVFLARRLTRLLPADDPVLKKAMGRLQTLDPMHARREAARLEFVGGMAALALGHDKAERPLLAMRTAWDALAVDPFDASALALIERLEEETGRSVIAWSRLFNGFDLSGWYTADNPNPFFVNKGELIADYALATDDSRSEGEGVSLYSTLFLDRDVRGDWSLEARLHGGFDWELIGLCFGAQASDDFEAIVLRRADDGQNRVDFGSFSGSWDFRGDGSFKATYDPTSPEGTLLRIDVRNRKVAVTIDGVSLKPVSEGKIVDAIQYPRAALRGDVGLLASRGLSRFGDLRLLAGESR